MRSEITLALALAGTLTACASPQTGRTCSPVSSWASPAFRCVSLQVATPEPIVETPVTPPPSAPEPAIAVKADTIDLKEKVEFETGSAELTASSKPLLDQVAQVMKDHPEIQKIRIDGHTDSTSTPSFNQKLSTQRAASVKDYLIAHGVDARRLSSKGFGQDKPIADNATEQGRADNRRVEIHIVERAN